jgi:hypothetical protein
VVDGGTRSCPRLDLRQRELTEALHALRVRSVQRQAGEELRSHAATAAGVVGVAAGARAAALRLAQLEEERALAPDLREAALAADVAGVELVRDGERAGVDVSHRVDQADDPAGAAEDQPGQRPAVGRQVEERVAGQHVLAVGDEPVVERALLVGRRVQLVPDIRATAARPQPGQPQLRAVAVGERLELVELAEVLPGADDGELRAHTRVVQVAERPDSRVVRPGTAHRVVDLGGGAVEGDLDVDVAVGGDASRGLGVDLDAVGRELHADVVRGRVVEQLPEVAAHRRLAAADVDVEDLHPLQLVDDGLALLGGQLARVAPAGAGQAVRAGEVARVGELPREADGRVEAECEVLHEGNGGGHATSRSSSVRSRRASAAS